MSARKDVLEKLAGVGRTLPPFVVRRFGAALTGSGIKLAADELAGLTLFLCTGGAVVGLFAGGPIIGLVLACSAGSIPVLGCMAKSAMRIGKVARQLEEWGLTMATEVHEGATFKQALERAAGKGPAALADELGRVLGEHAWGLPLVEALDRLGERARTPEIVQVVLMFRDHLETGKDPLDPFRNINFLQPFEMPAARRAPPVKSFEDAAYALQLAVLDSLDVRQLLIAYPPGGRGALARARVKDLAPTMRLPSAFSGEVEALADAVAAEVEGRGPLEPLLSQDSVQLVFVLSPQDVFAAGLPAGSIDAAPRTGGPDAPEGCQRARCRFRDAAHLSCVVDRLLSFSGAALTRVNPHAESALPGGWAIAADLDEAGGVTFGMERTA